MKSGSIQGLEECLAVHRNATFSTLDANHSTILQPQCPSVWDGFNCWEPTEAGEISYRPCPTVKGSVGSDSTYMAFRKCSLQNGKWLNKENLPSDLGWTNYTPCFTPEIREVIRRLGSKDEAQSKLNIAVNTRIVELVGLFLSLTALIVSLIIFYKFRTLRNTRTRLHRHLFIAVLIQTSIRLTLYIDQAITRTNHASVSSATSLSQENLPGIDNTPFLCEAGYIFLEYARTCMFFWMFIEGLYLHNRITVTVFEEKLSPIIYSIVGWIIPIPLTCVWTVVTWASYGSLTSCWWGYNFTVSYWILEGPRLGILLVNFAFLLNILRVLVTKLRRTSETDQIRKAVKAALLLLPLLGLTNLLNMLHAPLEKAAWIFGLWSYSTHSLISCQGLILSSLYCFNNGEVQLAIRKYFRSQILDRNKVKLPRSSLRMSLLNHTVVAQMDSGQRVKSNLDPEQFSQQPTPERLAPLLIPQSDGFVQARLKFNHSKSCNNEIQIQDPNSEERASINSKRSNISGSSSTISQLTRGSTIDASGGVEKLHGLRLFCQSSRRPSVCTMSVSENPVEKIMCTIYPNVERDVGIKTKDERRHGTEIEA